MDRHGVWGIGVMCIAGMMWGCAGPSLPTAVRVSDGAEKREAHIRSLVDIVIALAKSKQAMDGSDFMGALPWVYRAEELIEQDRAYLTDAEVAEFRLSQAGLRERLSVGMRDGGERRVADLVPESQPDGVLQVLVDGWRESWEKAWEKAHARPTGTIPIPLR